ncbi:ferrochelatase 1, partial [Prunus dulcis]
AQLFQHVTSRDGELPGTKGVNNGNCLFVRLADVGVQVFKHKSLGLFFWTPNAMNATSCSGVLPQMKLSHSDHKLSMSCSSSRSLGFDSCHSSKRLRLPKQLTVSCSTPSDKGDMFGVSHSCKKSPVGETLCPAGVYTYAGTVESHSHTAEEKVGVLLLNLGGPETLQDVQPFLFNLFADPDIIRLPRLFQFLQQPLAKLISVLRAPKSKEGYAAIGGGSPLRKITDEQANELKKALKSKDLPVNVYVGMRYWYPFTEEAVQQIKKDRITRLVVLPLYPQFLSLQPDQAFVCSRIFSGYIKSMADLISKQLEIFSEPAQVMIFFSAHGVPESYVKDAGDPYKDQMEECIFLIMEELKSRGINNEHTLAYQSRVGPVQWLKPYTDEVLVELGQKGVKSLLAVPVSFVSEHIETLEEIDMEYKELALESGIENWGRVPALGCTPSFIMDLADAVIEAAPLAKPMSTPRTTSEDVDHDPARYAIKLFFGSFLAFILFFSPKMIMAFRNHLI